MGNRSILKKCYIIILLFEVFSYTIIFPQNKVAGKDIISGTWKGNSVQYVKGEIGIKLKDADSSSQITDILSKYNAVAKHNFGKMRWGWISVPDSVDIMTVISELNNNSAVEVSEPNLITHLQLVPNDSYYSYQWALNNTGQVPPGGKSGADIEASKAWDITTGSSNVITAILDSGIPMLNGVLSHPDLNDTNKIIKGPDEIYGTDIQDNYGHGTHVAGIIGAESNNGVGITGINWNGKLLIIKAFDDYGIGTTSAFQQGVEYAVDYKNKNALSKMVINYSGGTYDAQAVEDGIAYANNSGVIVVASAGNNGALGGTMVYPAAYSNLYPNLIAVSATDQNDTVASYSSYGAAVDISAPGGWGNYSDDNIIRYNGTTNSGANIYSTTPNYPFNIQSDPNYLGDTDSTDVTATYGYLAGTSMSAAEVSGTVGLMLSINSTLTPSQIKEILENSADKVSGMNGQNFTDQFGYGRLNAYKAVLLSLVFQNNVLTDFAVGDNHNRTIAKGNYLYEALTSNGEIIVRRSSDNGTTWNKTNVLSSGNGNNVAPSILVYTVTGATDTVNIVWQRSLGSNYYDIYYAVSGNSGATWSVPVKIVSNMMVSWSQYSGPQPVIAGIARQGNINDTNSVKLDTAKILTGAYHHGVLVVYTSVDGLHSMTNYLQNGPNTWSTPISIPTSVGGSSVWYPSLASSGGDSSSGVFLSYDARSYHKIYSRYYTASTNSWSSEAVVYDGTMISSFDRQSCISVGKHVYDVWNSYNPNTTFYSIKFRVGNLNNTWNNWLWTYSSPSGDLYFPSITGYNSDADIAILEFTAPGHQVLLHKANLASHTWFTDTVSINGRFSNLLNINNDNRNELPVAAWTGTISGNYYPLSTNNLSGISIKDSNMTIYNRTILTDNLSITMGNISALTKDGRKNIIPFKNFNYLQNADLSVPWQYFETGDSLSLANVDSASLILSINQNYGNVLSPFELDIYNGEELAYTGNITASDYLTNLEIKFSVPGGTISCLKPVIKFSAKDTAISFKNINNDMSGNYGQWDKVTSVTAQPLLPKVFSLNQNYPNPFNPSTIISYSLPRSGHVTLKIYDILGREVSTLVNANQNAGSYNFSFNASRLASGVYFYQLRVRGASDNFVSTKKMQVLK